MCTSGDYDDVCDLIGQRQGNNGKQLLRAKIDGRPVVLKGCTNIGSLRQFEREIAALKSLDHPNIIVATGVTKTHTTEAVIFYLELEYCSCGSMSEWMTQTKPSRETVVRMLRGVLRALVHVHSLRVGPVAATHSDVKPTNILVSVWHIGVFLSFTTHPYALCCIRLLFKDRW